ncbi:hypothetical protein J14TS5_20080 [Paenibacillus lautus]|uniref:hypothetical protein n=1 Tax=Paenibacillus lautus TaxID=1401 RepID=UPI001B048E68|nr:hypothetical protein [Paenibacillus lautus]GIO96922.1 hypothetical protein J14TS5_20080 [Paenibacillus lautus]
MNWNYSASDEAYEAMERYWKRLFVNMLGVHDADDWITPYYKHQFADGTPMRDANPIFSAFSRTSGRSVRIILEPMEEFDELRHWVDENEGKKELVIVSASTELQVVKAGEILEAWLNEERR